MSKGTRAFTLAELLTVLAIIAILAGLLFPVFLSAKSVAKRGQCLSNMHQAQLAAQLYIADYDEIFMPVNHRPAAPPNAQLDRTWVQLILPYAKSFSIFTCPADTSLKDESVTTFDQDLVPGDIYGQYYAASMRVDMGYNYLYLSPIVFKRGQWVSEPRSTNDVANPSKTLMFVDSIWNRTANGTPVGGGNWLVMPPCRYINNGGGVVADTFVTDGIVYAPGQGWKPTDPNSARRYGFAWPWHYGRTNLARVDGSVTSVSVVQLSAGCSVRDGWGGRINSSSDYVWDTH